MNVLWSAFHTPSSSCTIISSGRTWHLVKLQGSAESETWRIQNVHICTATLSWTHLVSPVIAESFRTSPAVSADTHLTSWHGGHDISTAAISRDGNSWLRDEGICWRFLTDCDRIQGVWRIDAEEENCLSYPSVSAGEYQRAALIFHLHGYFYRAHSLFPDAKSDNFRFCVLWSTEQNLWWLTMKSNLLKMFLSKATNCTFIRRCFP